MAGTVPLKPSTGTKPLGGGQAGREPLFMEENPVFKGKNGSYEVLGDQCIGNGGESQVFLARNKSNGEIVVAKIYDQFQNTRTNRENRNQVISFVQNHSDYRNSHIMPIIDYGWVSVNLVGEDIPFQYPIDILPFCKDGEIKKASFNELRQSIIPQIVGAIHLMHSENLAHRDIKPGNIYRYNDTIVIADFGTSCSIGQYEMFGTQTRRGTLGYTAPEVWQGYVVMASDYYSLGCTIATLYKGEHVYQHLIDLNDEGAINRSINAGGLPLNCPVGEESLQVLVDALTVMRETERAGYEGVQLWLTDPKAFEQKFKRKKLNEAEKPFEIKFNDVMCYSERDLASLMSKNWEYSKRNLYSNNPLLPHFYSSYDYTKATKISEVLETKETARNQDYGLAKILHLIYPEGPVYWKGRAFTKLSDISDAISQKTVPEDDIAAMLACGYISWKLSNTSGASPAVIQGVKNVEKIAKNYKILACLYAKYQFSGNGKQQSFRGLTTADDIFAQITKNPKAFNQDGVLYSDDEMLAYLAFLGFKDNVLYFKSHLGSDAPKNVELAYRFFEAVCTNKAAVRAYYIRYSPRSYLYWVKQNLDLYSFNSAESKQIRTNIANEQLETSTTIDEISRHFIRLSEYMNDFMRLFHNNVLLAFMGIGCGKDTNGITSTNSDAYFLESYCGYTVPVGFVRYISAKR